MKKSYEMVEIEVLILQETDAIRTSGFGGREEDFDFT